MDNKEQITPAEKHILDEILKPTLEQYTPNLIVYCYCSDQTSVSRILTKNRAGETSHRIRNIIEVRERYEHMVNNLSCEVIRVNTERATPVNVLEHVYEKMMSIADTQVIQSCLLVIVKHSKIFPHLLAQ
jgi:deoxyadenosine/deoxycytidine kinase